MTQNPKTPQVQKLLASFGLKQAAASLPQLIDDAERDNLTPRQFLLTVLETELNERNEKKRKRNYAGAHFPPYVPHIDEFDTTELEGGITATQILQLKELNWIDTASNILFVGPPGLGKTMLALGLGLEAINAGYSVCYERMVGLIGLLDDAKRQRQAAFRLRRLLKADLVIIDEIGYVPITREQANAFFSFVSDLYERSSIIVTSNKDVGQWAEVLGDPVLATALLDRLLHHCRCFSLRGESYRLKHPEPGADTGGAPESSMQGGRR